MGWKARGRDGGHTYALSPFGGGTGWMVGFDEFSIKESKRWMIDMICFCIADTLVASMSTEEVRSDVSSPAEWEVRVLFDPLDRVDLSLDRIELGEAERFLRPFGVVVAVLSVITLLLGEEGWIIVVGFLAAKVEIESVSCCWY